jgi:molybdate/tungstate transport system substrate-binding protein
MDRQPDPSCLRAQHRGLDPRRIASLIALPLLLPAAGCRRAARNPSVPGETGGELSGMLTIFHAGSLSVPFGQVSDLFRQRHPNVPINAEAAGSRDCARKIRDLGRRCDVFGSADYDVVQGLLMPEYADFNIRFATNRMSIAYTDRSRMADNIRGDNWYDVLLEPGVAFGRSDPNSDPCGYRALMTFQLAEKHYRLPGLAEKLKRKDGDRFIRPKETDLLALLESGEIDYVLIYQSVARQHGLRYVELPDEINLGNPGFAHLYRTAKVRVTGKQPGEFTTQIGAPMVYSVTIPTNAPNPRLAEAWVALLLSPDGQTIMVRNGQPVIQPAQTDGFDRLPVSLTPFCRPAGG